MYLGPYTLFDIIDTGEGELLQVTEIIFDIEARLNHTLNRKHYHLKENTLQTCQESNEEQVKSITKSIEEVKESIPHCFSTIENVPIRPEGRVCIYVMNCLKYNHAANN